MKIKHLLLMAVAAVMVAGCQTNDPTKGGLFGGIGGLASGNYEQGVADREKKLEDAQDEKVSFQRETQRVQDQNESLNAKLAAAETQLSALSDDVAALEKMIEAARADSSIDQTEVDRIEDELGEIEAEIEAQQLTFDEQQKLTEIEQLKRRKDLLEEALLILIE